MPRKIFFVFISLIVIGAVLAVASCSKDKIVEFEPFDFEPIGKSDAYSFFVAGHANGFALADNIGFDPIFRDHLHKLQSSGQNVDFGFLTGDVVRKGRQVEWSAVRQDIAKLRIPAYISRGNHDENPPLFFKGQTASYYDFSVGDDVFIVLDATLSDWRIEGEQLEFLARTLKNSAGARNIFVFTHQLIWWSPENEFRCAQMNSEDKFKKRPNFHTDVMPLFENLNSQIYFFAGDVGAIRHHRPVYAEQDNLHFIASGMGGGNGNYLTVRVTDDVKIDLHWLHTVDAPRTPDHRRYIAKNRPLITDYTLECE